MLLSAEQISKNYGACDLLDRVSLYLNPGDRIGVVGRNGAGKSTLLRILAGEEEPDAGTVQRDPNVRLEYLPQDPAYDAGNTVLEQVFADLSPEARALAEYEAKTILTRLGFTGFERRMGELSGGERQRISIARAFLKDAPIILLDEATASLDVENETAIQEALSRLIQNKTVLIIAHRMRTVSSADKIVVLKEGTVAEEGSPAELLHQGGLFAHMVQLQTESQNWTLGTV